jgi:flagellar motor switch protein FliG
MSNQGVKRSAILLMALGEEAAAEVLRQLSPRDVQALGAAMIDLQNVSREDIEQVVTDFRSEVGNLSPIASVDQNEYLKSVMKRALGDDKASTVLDRILATGDSAGIEGLKWMDPPSVAELIKDEHPQIISTILAHFEPSHAAETLKCFTERLRNDVVLRIATLDGVQPSALKELNEVMSKVLAGGENMRRARLGGVKAAAEILNLVGKEAEQGIMANMEQHDSNLAEAIMDEMFTFDDLIQIDDRGFQTLLREVSSDMLIVALRGAPDELKEKILRNMSKRAAETMREDMENRGPVKVSDVEDAQKEIISIVRQLADDGQIMIAGQGGDDAYV